jgi:diamine N-acetyltransferase
MSAPLRQLRPATQADIPLIRQLAERIWWASYREMLSDAQIRYMLDWMYAPDRIDEEMTRGIAYELMEIDGIAAGYLATEPMDSPPRVRLHKLYLLAELHGHGHGQWMLAQVTQRAVERGLACVELGVNKQNHRALRAYRRAGFEIVTSVISDIGHGFVMDDYILRRSVP